MWRASATPLRATLKKAADDTAQARAELGLSGTSVRSRSWREMLLCGNWNGCGDERARRHAREHTTTPWAAGLARSELDAARSRSAEASRRALEAESKLADLQHEHESSLRDLKAQCDRYQRERDVAREDAQHALQREEAGRAERQSLEEALRDATASANARKRQIGVACSRGAREATSGASSGTSKIRSGRGQGGTRKSETGPRREHRRHQGRVGELNRQIATAAASEADEDWSCRLAEAVRDVRDRCIQRDRDQADEIASLRQALHLTSKLDMREQLNRERQVRIATGSGRGGRIETLVNTGAAYVDLP